MKSQTLTFDLYDDLKFFNVEFESQSAQRNLLMKVEYEGFQLDTVELRSTHPALYAKIKSKMTRKAEKFWTEEPIPTLAYQENKSVKVFDEIIKSSFSHLNG